jgi:hypothetical protein
MTVVLLDKPFSDEQLSKLEIADLRTIGKAVLQRVLSNCRANDLSLYHITLDTLDGIDSLSNVQRVTLEWGTKIQNMEPVFRMSQLTSLSVSDFPKLRDLSGIESLNKLIELNLSGSLGATTPSLHLTSIKEVAQIPNLLSFCYTTQTLRTMT